MIELAIADAANEAVQVGLTPDSDGPVEALWAVAWWARSAAWMGRIRGVLGAGIVQQARARPRRAGKHDDEH